MGAQQSRKNSIRTLADASRHPDTGPAYGGGVWRQRFATHTAAWADWRRGDVEAICMWMVLQLADDGAALCMVSEKVPAPLQRGKWLARLQQSFPPPAALQPVTFALALVDAEGGVEQAFYGFEDWKFVHYSECGADHVVVATEARVFVWARATGALLHVVEHGCTPLHCAQLFANGQLALAAHRDAVGFRVLLLDVAQGALLRSHFVPAPDGLKVWVWGPTPATVLLATDGEVYEWAVAAGERTRTLGDSGAHSLCWTADRAFLVVERKGAKSGLSVWARKAGAKEEAEGSELELQVSAAGVRRVGWKSTGGCIVVALPFAAPATPVATGPALPTPAAPAPAPTLLVWDLHRGTQEELSLAAAREQWAFSAAELTAEKEWGCPHYRLDARFPLLLRSGKGTGYAPSHFSRVLVPRSVLHRFHRCT